MIKKSLIEQYSCRENPWFIISVDEETLALNCQSDHGNYSYRWHTIDKSFKKFLIDCDSSYIMDKLSYNGGGKDWFDWNATEKEVKRQILEARRTGDMEKEEARDAWEDIGRIIGDADTTKECVDFIWESKVLRMLFGDDICSIPIIMDYRPQLRMFMEKCWPRFISYIKEEMEDGKVQK